MGRDPTGLKGLCQVDRPHHEKAIERVLHSAPPGFEPRLPLGARHSLSGSPIRTVSTAWPVSSAPPIM